jgi:hypothetical protein
LSLRNLGDFVGHLENLHVAYSACVAWHLRYFGFTGGDVFVGDGSGESFLFPSVTISGLLDRYAASMELTGTGLQIHRVSIASPGVFSIDGGAALGRIVDILHKGDLEREERAAIIDRIGAETRLLEAQAAEIQIANTAATIQVLKDIGYSQAEIRDMIMGDPNLTGALGQPLVQLTGMKQSGMITEVAREDV